MSVCKVILVGNLGSDPEVRYTSSGTPVANFSVATNERWNDAKGKRQEHTEWHRVIVWGKMATVCSEYLSKGRQVYIEGKLRTRAWTDKDNNKRYTTEIIANQLNFLGGGRGKNTQEEHSTEVPEAVLPTISEEAKQLLGIAS